MRSLYIIVFTQFCDLIFFSSIIILSTSSSFCSYPSLDTRSVLRRQETPHTSCKMDAKSIATEKPRITFLSLPGLCTGDVFHTAAAQILWNLYPNDPRVKMVTLITVPENAGPRVLDERFGLVPVMYNYFKNLNLPVIVAKIPIIQDGDEEDCERAAAKICGEQLQLLMTSQIDQREVGFSDLWLSLETLELKWNAQEPIDLAEASIILPPLHHYAATTIVTGYFNDKISSKANTSYANTLQGGLSGHLSIGDGIYQDATDKIGKLKTLIAKARTSAGPGFEAAKILLFVYRHSHDGPQSMNPRQNTCPGLLSQVRSLAQSQDLLTIRIPHGSPPNLLEDGDLDIFDVADPTQSRMKDKRYAPSFWTQVSQMPDIFGAVGGRTGSLDIAAFCGVRCFEWDEPLLCSDAARRHKRNYLDRQIPQHLRMLTQASLMSLGVLDSHSWNQETELYERVCEEPLEEWFDGKDDVFPKILRDTDIVRSYIFALELKN
jgi:hypothetical protein